MNQPPLSYVLITPARNEGDYIELTLKSVVNQSIPPRKWIVVSDGSTDRTDEIVREYAARHPFIELLRMPEQRERSFAAKVDCINAGLQRLKGLAFDLIGCMDADISFQEDFFAFLLERFQANPRLGLAGTPFTEGNTTYDFRFSSVDHVSGACQLFRRECFEAIGGYTPVKGGGIDVIAVLTARMKGWETRSFTEKTYIHHRPMGAAKHKALRAKVKLGEKDYVLGRHPLWQVFRSLYQMTRKPVLIGGCGLLWGFFWAMARRVERPVSRELIEFQRREQMARLKKFVLR